MEDGTKPDPAGRVRTLRFRVTVEEGQEIEALAESGGLTASAYLRAAALNHPIRSVYDLDAVADLVKVNGDLGRVAGLLKLWLAEKRGQGARPVDVEKVMMDFRGLQAEVSALIGRVTK